MQKYTLNLRIFDKGQEIIFRLTAVLISVHVSKNNKKNKNYRMFPKYRDKLSEVYFFFTEKSPDLSAERQARRNTKVLTLVEKWIIELQLYYLI